MGRGRGAADDAPPLDVDVPPQLELRRRLVHPNAPPAAPAPLPPLVRPDPQGRNPRPTRWQSIEIDAEGSAEVTYARGLPERLHSIEARRDDNTVIVTVKVGSGPEKLTHPVPLVALIERAKLDLPIRFTDGGQS